MKAHLFIERAVQDERNTKILLRSIAKNLDMHTRKHKEVRTAYLQKAAFDARQARLDGVDSARIADVFVRATKLDESLGLFGLAEQKRKAATECGLNLELPEMRRAH